MKTVKRIFGNLKILAIAFLIVAVTVAVNAQPRGKGKNHGHKEYKRSYTNEYKHSYRKSDRDYYAPVYHRERVYVQRAPWGNHHPRIYSHNHGKLYYYRGNYYEYHPSHGYCMIEIPAGYYFDAVPYGFKRVWIDNAWCYHRDNLYLRPSVHGFVTFHRPGLTIGASF